MSFVVTMTANISWVGDGTGGSQSFNPNGPTLQLTNTQTVPGFSTPGTTPSAANFNTAIVAAGAAISVAAQTAATLARLQGFGNGTTQ